MKAMRNRKYLSLFTFALAVAFFCMNCQCLDAAEALPNAPKAPSCHSEDKEKSPTADCCGRCQIENAAIHKKDINFEESLDTHIFFTPEVSTELQKSSSTFKHKNFYKNYYSSIYLSSLSSRGPPTL